ncbi:MAG: RNA polymerase sigma factor [Bacteroidetes bacterium]|nr:RNA polymerase sigma factor [Bacteroidota bacterium]
MTNEALLLTRLREGDHAVYKDLIRQFGNQVFNTSLGILQDTMDAEDITQEVFIEVFRSVRNFRGDAKLSTWIYRIAVTKSLEHLRKRNSKKGIANPLTISGDDPIGNISEVPDFLHPGVQMENKERAAILFAAIGKLPEKQKTAFILHKTEDLSYTEVAEIMNVSVSSVESLLFRAKQNLQKLFEK